MTDPQTANVIHVAKSDNDLEPLCEHPRPAFIVDGPGKTPTGVSVYTYCEECVSIWNMVAFVQGDILFPEEKLYKRNAVLCKKCGTVAESTRRHETNRCECGAVGVDGGLDYLRRICFEGAEWEELSENADGSRVES